MLEALELRILHMVDELGTRRARTLPLTAEEKAAVTACPRGEEATPFALGEALWGGDNPWWTFAFKLTPPKVLANEKLFLLFSTALQGPWETHRHQQLLLRINGKAVQGLDLNHARAWVDPAFGDKFEATVEGYVGAPPMRAGMHLSYEVQDEDITGLYFDMKVAIEATRALDAADYLRDQAANALIGAVDMLDFKNPDAPAFRTSVLAAREHIKKHYYGALSQHAQGVHHAIGHTHIDIAWLWDIEQTRHKAVRSFSTVLHLMKQYPSYKFMSSQPILYTFLEDGAPELMPEVADAVKSGRWQPEGGMWVEADCNLASGEALVRQFLVGQTYFKEKYGEYSRILWLPDVFGYAYALPQILKKCGIDYFTTIKISWNDTNPMPHSTFIWRGLDDSQVLTHFMPAQDDNMFYRYRDVTFGKHRTTYNGNLTANLARRSWEFYKDKGLDEHFMTTYGFGDGGGGPTEDMLETATRLQKGLPGLPKLIQTQPRAFFEDLETRLEDKDVPVWAGELYLEYHRGTYTSMARNKKWNRESELLYRHCELLSTAAWLSGGAYPALDWQTLLTNQFHDILPGSSIEKVYEDSKADYLRILAEASSLRQDAAAFLAARLSGDIAVFSHAPADGLQVTTLPDALDAQALSDGTGVYAIQNGIAVLPLAQMGVTAFSKAEKAASAGMLEASDTVLENDFIRLELNADGNLASLFDKRQGREVLSAPARLAAYSDKPLFYDAWDIDSTYTRTCWPLEAGKAELIECGEVYARIRVTRMFDRSSIEETYTVYRALEKVDVAYRIDWKQAQVLLRAEYPLDIYHNSATYDIQYGNVARPAHRNTSWDEARFEVPAHKWADVSEPHFGFSILNNGKYGHACDERGLSVTLIKSGIYPNPNADKEVHEFTLALLPHAGDWRGRTITEAYALNCPPLALITGQDDACRALGSPEQAMLAASGLSTAPIALACADGAATSPSGSFFKITGEGVILEAVKRSEDEQSVILRVYECHGARTRATLSTLFDFSSAHICDLLERPEGELPLENGTLSFDIHPYEILTFRLSR